MGLSKPKNVTVDGGGLEMELLWENASPTSNFNPQKINLDLSKYDGAYVTGNAITTPDPYKIHVGVILIGEYNRLWFHHGGDKTLVSREVQCSIDGVNFGAVRCSGTSDGNNAHCIPLQIYGVKGFKKV